MFVQNWICQVSIKSNSTKILTLSKLFTNFDFTIANASLFCYVTLRMEEGYYKCHIITCFNPVEHKHSSGKVKGNAQFLFLFNPQNQVLHEPPSRFLK